MFFFKEFIRGREGGGRFNFILFLFREKIEINLPPSPPPLTLSLKNLIHIIIVRRFEILIIHKIPPPFPFLPLLFLY